jgi:hypothetical protein
MFFQVKKMNIIFAGVKGEIISSSPHNSFVIVKLSDRIYLCGAYNNKFNWSSESDNDSGFESFIVYLGVNNEAELNKFKPIITFNNGYIDSIRPAKRVKGFIKELKIRDLKPDGVIELLNN